MRRGVGARLLPQAAAIAVAVAVACCMAGAAAQGTTTPVDAGGVVPSCASKLVTCAGYLNTTDTPPESCCEPLKEAATTQAACMCAILMNRAALQAFGVAPEQGVLLAKRCGVTTDASTCAKYAAGAGADAATAGSTAASSASTGTAASTVAKPAASGGSTHPLSLMAASSFVGLSFIWWTIMA
ncbi:non-specific lipid transfer protein GPI-anchored 7-like [Hordeum vulgare subsp. vulgare]|uniref:Bifunctional inhibitor/plant lipid transfer protein/seed storage helical domain-containing protein n=1 Tax=Hordeum vulgare subsp. vulgare TaxID=112509 RepID=A0A8I7BJQ6_HORVV|nr:non-specific lipid transfer protein GPI-anchored 7-like [Hordeum vulgare subsp. vulgare]